MRRSPFLLAAAAEVQAKDVKCMVKWGKKKERADSWEKVQSVSVGELVKANIFWK